ncbi:MAG TPA: 16S rRNA (cytosine(967)-C(5))-methyltransferase, partial [Gammaproteobacteria bacterium]|nr:16S rRNA (cytosine(967)-C(5))-methyltransferase [Gammaproteobacteria bacterium]
MSDANYKNNDSSTDSRKAALNTLLMVLKEGQSLSSLAYLTEKLEPRDAAFARMLSFGVLRYYEQLQALLKPLVKKPLRSKDLDVQLVILIA